MTALRRRILELLWASGRPTGAYELIEAVTRRDSRPVGPPTVYRALEFLMLQGLVSRIESLNAYVPCVHPVSSETQGHGAGGWAETVCQRAVSGR